MNTPLPHWAATIIENPPRSGGGFHHWLFRASRALWKCGRSEADILPLLESAAANCGRPVSDSEIQNAMFNSRPVKGMRNTHTQAPWARMNAELRESIITASGAGMADLREASPVRFDDTLPHTEEIIDQLFPADTLLCCGREQKTAHTQARETWRGKLAKKAFIVPSPMTAETGKNQAGKTSDRCLANTGPRRFIVVEFDAGSIDEQAALHLHLAERAPLALSVHSGSKSVHGWYYCAGQAEETVRRFFNYAVSLGADRAMWARCQLARMPDGTRDNGNRQHVLFFNPEVAR